MTRRCFFVECVEPDQRMLILTEGEAHHMETVLRIRPGERVEVRNGRGRAWWGVVDTLEKGKVHVLLEDEVLRKEEPESPVDLTLALAYARSERMEGVVRQATELGVRRIVAFRAGRSQYGLDGRQSEKRRERWVRITREALCQCGRLVTPEVVPLGDISDFFEWTAAWENESVAAGRIPGSEVKLKVVASEGERQGDLRMLHLDFPRCARLLAVVGPEGGWMEGERAHFGRAGFKAVGLGPRILRFETAAAALVALIQMLWGDLGQSA